MRNVKMKPSILIPLAGMWMFGCAPKPKPGPVHEPVAPDLAAQAPLSDFKAPDEDTRRQRMLQRAREVFQTIYFPYDQASLDDQARQALANIRSYLTEYPEVSVSVEGHADERGTNEYNLALGDRRSNAVATYLATLGVPKSCFKTISFGEERPAREGHSEGDWKLNRRVEFAPAL